MQVNKAAKIWINYHTAHSKKKYSAFVPDPHRTVLSGVR